MFKSTYSIGKSGELLGSTHLVSLGFKIIEKNWRFVRFEIDIIAENQEFIVFAEVKLRSSDSFGKPEEFVSRKQQRRIIEAANAYIMEHDIQKEARFDIIAIDNGQTKKQIEHIPNAFYPVL